MMAMVETETMSLYGVHLGGAGPIDRAANEALYNKYTGGEGALDEGGRGAVGPSQGHPSGGPPSRGNSSGGGASKGNASDGGARGGSRLVAKCHLREAPTPR